MINKFKKYYGMFKAMISDNSKLAPERKISQHLAKVLVYELKGVDMLYPDLKEKYIKLEKRMAKLGQPVKIAEGFRSFKKQNDYYSKGRTTKGSVITNAKGGQSYHNYCLAVDVIHKTKNWNAPYDFWELLGKEGKKLGLEWGGDWEGFRDRPHFQYNPNNIFEWEGMINYFKK